MNWYNLVKTSSSIDIPPRLLVEVERICLQKYREFLSHRDEMRSNYYGKATNENKDWTSGPVKVRLDLTGWRYGGNELIEKASKKAGEEFDESNGSLTQEQRELIWGEKDVEDMKEMYLDHVRYITIAFKNDCSVGVGASWQPALGVLSICMNKVRGIQELNSFIEHELRHFCQTYLNYLINGNMLANSVHEHGVGLPSKKIRTPQFNQSNGGQVNYLDQEKIHDLDDIEFYTLLATEIENAKALKLKYLNHPNYIKVMRSIIDRIITGQPFFKYLRENAYGKYRKAISELVKAVDLGTTDSFFGGKK